MAPKIHDYTSFLLAFLCAALFAVPQFALAQTEIGTELKVDTREDSSASPKGADIASVYVNKCARCHGPDGQGVADGEAKPLRADKSVAELTKLIVETMPEDDPDSCVGDEARKLAEYIRSHFQLRPATVSRISRLSSMGIGGRPGRDFQRQNRRKPARCQPMKVFGVTFASASCHAKP